MGFLILPQHWEFTINASLNFRPWRILILLNTFPGFLATMCLCCLPESGKFLIAQVCVFFSKFRILIINIPTNDFPHPLQGNECEAINVLRRIYAMNSGCSADSFSVTHLLPEAVGESSKSTTRSRGFLASFWEQTVPLFKRPLRFHFLICCFLTFGVFFVYIIYCTTFSISHHVFFLFQIQIFRNRYVVSGDPESYCAHRIGRSAENLFDIGSVFGAKTL